MSKIKKLSSTQQYLPISHIEQDIVVMRNGSIKGILKAYPINFELKSETEQNAIVYGYQSFLNSLKFPIQIVVRSKKLDLERYLVKLESQVKNITNNLLIIHAQDYIGFMRRLVQIANIMSKQFYIVVSYQVVATNKNTLMNYLPMKKSGPKITDVQFTNLKNELTNRLNIIQSGLSGFGIKTEILTTQQIIELFYNIYNPEESMTERLAPVQELKADVIESTTQNMDDQVFSQNTAPAPQNTIVRNLESSNVPKPK